MCIRKESVRLYFSFHFFKLLGVKYSGGLKDLIFLDCAGIRPERARTRIRFPYLFVFFSYPLAAIGEWENKAGLPSLSAL